MSRNFVVTGNLHLDPVAELKLQANTYALFKGLRQPSTTVARVPTKMIRDAPMSYSHRYVISAFSAFLVRRFLSGVPV